MANSDKKIADKLFTIVSLFHLLGSSNLSKLLLNLDYVTNLMSRAQLHTAQASEVAQASP